MINPNQFRSYRVLHESIPAVSDSPPSSSSSQSKELLKAYPPFVNFFEMSKETITRCEKQKPRFHAFLKVIFISLSKYTTCFWDDDYFHTLVQKVEY